MIGKTNAGTGKCVALIHVYYKAGTSCTCTKGLRVFHSDTSGEYVFLLPETGDWTVAGTSSADVEKSITVTVARGESKLVTLATLIPPSDRTTYQEVEYLQILTRKGNVPLGINSGSGIWQYELESFTPVEFLGAAFTPNIIGSHITGSAGPGLHMSQAKPVFWYHGDSGAHPTAAEDLVAGIAKKVTMMFKHCPSGHTFTAPYATLHFDDREIFSLSTAKQLNTNEIFVGWGSDSSSRPGFPAKYGRITIKQKEAEADEFTVVGDFVPCKQRSNDLPGFYNLVTNTFKQARAEADASTIADILAAVGTGPAIGT